MKPLGTLLAASGSLMILGGLGGGTLLRLARSALLGMAEMMEAVGPTGTEPAGPLQDLALVAGAKGSAMLVLAGISLAALISGIGLIRGRRWGRIAGLIWAPIALLYLVGEVLLEILAVAPAISRAADALAADLAEGGTALADTGVPASWLGSLAGLGTVATVFNALLLAVVPILTLALLTRGKR